LAPTGPAVGVGGIPGFGGVAPSGGGGGGGGGIGGFLKGVAQVVGSPVTYELNRLFGHDPVVQEAQRFNEDIANQFIWSLPGIYHLGGGIAHHPIPTIENFGKGLERSLTPSQIWQHPGNALSTALLGTGLGFGTVGRVGELGRLGVSGGALRGSLADAIAAARAADPSLETNLAAAKSIGRGPEYTRAMKLGAGGRELGPKSVGRQAFATALRGLPPRERILQTPSGTPVHGWWFSKNLGIQSAQMAVDKLHDWFPDSAPLLIRAALPPLWRSQASRIKSASMAASMTANKEATALGAAFAKKWAGVQDVAHMAARMVLEGTLPKDLLQFHKDMLAEGKLSPKDTAATQARIPLIQEAAKMLTTKTHDITDETGAVFKEKVPVVKTEHADLQKFVDEARDISNKRTLASRFAGILDKENSYNRTLAVRNYVKHRQLVESTTRLKRRIARHEALGNRDVVKRLQERLSAAEGQTMLKFGGAKTPGQEYGGVLQGDMAQQLVEKAGLAYVPYKFIENRGPDAYGTLGFKRAVRLVRKAPPASFTHHFEAQVLKAGGGETNISQLLAASYTEAARYLHLKANYDRIVKTAQATPEGIPVGHRILVALDPKNKFIPTLKGASERAMQPFSEDLTAEDHAAAVQQYDHARSHLFPAISETLHNVLGNNELVNRLIHGTDPKQFTPVKGYGWVDDRTLGGMDKTNPLATPIAERASTRLIAQTFDAVNNAERFAILYLKPAYAVPNMLGNVGFNLIQQGFLQPATLAKSALLNFWLDPESRALINHGMEGGIYTSLEGKGVASGIRAATEKFSKAYGSFVDAPFRVASFLHEAGDAGFTSAAEIHQLLTDDAFQGVREDIFSRANDEIVNYERLGPGEQAILRRLVFFYPWIKGSTRYFSQMFKNHPTAAGLIGSSGQVGQQWVHNVLGDLPSYLEGVIPYSGGYGTGQAMIGNPSSLSPFGTPANLLEMTNQLLAKNPNQSLNALQTLAPVYSSALALASLGKLTTTKHPTGENIFKTAGRELVGSQPLTTLWRGITNQAPYPGSVYGQMTPNEALLRYFLLGGLGQRPLNVNEANYKAWLEQNPPKYSGG
jgi:hypothetical protein